MADTLFERVRHAVYMAATFSGWEENGVEVRCDSKSGVRVDPESYDDVAAAAVKVFQEAVDKPVETPESVGKTSEFANTWRRSTG